MTNYRYLGYGVTDSNGVAKLDHKANGDPLTHSYTGVGAGEVDVVASLDNPVSSGSIVSEIYEVLDATFLDRGTISSHNDTYFYPANYTQYFTRTESNTNVNLTNPTGGTVTHPVSDGMRFEMEVTEMETYCQVNVVRTETDKSPSYHGQKYTSACKIRIDVLPTQTIFKQVINGVETTVQTINNSTNNTMRIYFPKVDNTDAKFTFKNFAIYPI